METEDFLKDLETSNEQFGENTEQVVEPKETEEEPRNRRERRLEKRLQDERESGIALAARLQALTETQKFSQETTPSEYEKLAERIYGTETPEGIAATELLKSALKGVHQEATKNALEQFREEQRKASEAVAKETKVLDDMIEEIEDEHGITIDANTSKAFFAKLERMSPKDKDGKVLQYADHHAVWEDFQATKAKPNNRAKELASRSMTTSGSGSTENIQMNSTERYLKEQGLI